MHQIFVPGRRAQVKDVIIDSAGAKVGIGAYLTTQLSHIKIKAEAFRTNT